MKLFRKLFAKKYYWYSLKYSYRKNGTEILSWNTEVGLTDKNMILDDRALKKIMRPLHKRGISKSLLCNGTLGVTRLAYLGRFEKPKNRTYE